MRMLTLTEYVTYIIFLFLKRLLFGYLYGRLILFSNEIMGMTGKHCISFGFGHDDFTNMAHLQFIPGFFCNSKANF